MQNYRCIVIIKKKKSKINSFLVTEIFQSFLHFKSHISKKINIYIYFSHFSHTLNTTNSDIAYSFLKEKKNKTTVFLIFQKKKKIKKKSELKIIKRNLPFPFSSFDKMLKFDATARIDRVSKRTKRRGETSCLLFSSSRENRKNHKNLSSIPSNEF